MKTLKKFPLVAIIFLYIIANFFMFLNNGRFWDDWCLITTEGVKEIAYGTGSAYMIPINLWLNNLTSKPPLLFHILTGVLEIAGIIMFYKALILLDVKSYPSFLLTLLFALLPFNSAKIAMIDFGYTIGFFTFILAILLFIIYIKKKKILIRILSLLFFLLSYLFLPSTLVMALVFYLFMAFFLENPSLQFNIENLKKTFKKLTLWLDFIILPFIFWIFRWFFLKPTGIYAAEGYRQFSIGKFLMLPLKLVISFIQNFLGISSVESALNNSKLFALLFVTFFIVVIILLGRNKPVKLKPDIRLFYIGIFFFVAAVFPYNMVGLSPSFTGFSSRHQILLKIGTPFLLFYIISLIYSKKAQKVVTGIVISLFIISTIKTQLQFQKSWFKELSIISNFSNNKLLKDNRNFVIRDYTPKLNEYSEHHNFYVYTGILYKTFGNQTRFAIDLKSLKNGGKPLPEKEYVSNAFYNMRNAKDITNFEYWVIIQSGSVSLTNLKNLKLLYQYYFDKLSFNKEVSNIITIKVIPYR